MGRLERPKVVALGSRQAPRKVTPTAPVQRLRSASILRRLQTPTALSISQENAGSALARNQEGRKDGIRKRYMQNLQDPQDLFSSWQVSEGGYVAWVSIRTSTPNVIAVRNPGPKVPKVHPLTRPSGQLPRQPNPETQRPHPRRKGMPR
jgi:hypothetical protein